MSRFQPRPLSEQVVVLTGASSGIGRKTAHLLAEKGASLVLAARNEAALHEVAREVEERGGKAIVVPTDVSDKEQVDALAARAAAHFGRFDTWINDAAVSMYSYLRTQPIEDFEQILKVNVMGTVYGAQAAIPHLAKQGGTLINIGSVLSERSIPLQGAYCASKHAVKGFTESLRMELDYEKLPINVSLIKPAVIDTPFYTQAKSLIGTRPRAVPPIYDVFIAAQAIAFACEHYRRDIYVGGAALALGNIQKFAPQAIDEFMKHGGDYFGYFEGQMLKGTPDDGRSNLYRPLPGTNSSGGDNAERSRSVRLPDPVTNTLEFYPVLKQGLACLAVGALAAVLSNRKRA